MNTFNIYRFNNISIINELLWKVRDIQLLDNFSGI